jgi:hypothetical protein
MARDLVERRKEEDFHFYPIHFLMCVLDDTVGADRTIANLLTADVAPEDIHTWRGEDGLRALDSEGEFHGWQARVWRRIEHSTGEHAIWADYANALKDGHVVVAVRCTGSKKLAVSGLLTAQGARLERYFTFAGIEEIRPESPRHEPTQDDIFGGP